MPLLAEKARSRNGHLESGKNRLYVQKDKDISPIFIFEISKTSQFACIAKRVSWFMESSRILKPRFRFEMGVGRCEMIIGY